MKTLHEMLRYFGAPLGFEDIALTGLFRDSRQVTESSVFVAVQGATVHGLAFMEQALANGAKLILSDQPVTQTLDVPVIVCAGLSEELPSIACWFYDNPSKNLKVIGITGTNGKTSTAHFLAQLLASDPKQGVGVLGTLGNGVMNELRPSPNTTLETLALNHQLNAFVQRGITYVVMEVSSHAVALHRIDRIHFEGLVLTQVTRDHLDFHETETAYRATKKRLFTDFSARFWVVNQEDTLGQELCEAATAATTYTYAKQDSSADLYWQPLQFDRQGFSGTLHIRDRSMDLSVPLFGRFNVENLLAAMGAYGALMGWTFDELLFKDALKRIAPVPGRMQKVLSEPTVIVDYAHTPDALASILTAVRDHMPKHSDQVLYLLFGCGGNRDRGKRPLMGAVAERMADKVVITDDNPRDEIPDHIVQDILEGMNVSPDVIHSRPDAVKKVISEARPQDIVILAGKGHEDYQEVQGMRWPMKDSELVQNAVEHLKKIRGEAHT